MDRHTRKRAGVGDSGANPAWYCQLVTVRGIGIVGLLCSFVVGLGSVVTPAWAEEDSPVPVPIVDAVALSPHDRSKRRGVEPGSVVLALHAVRRLPQASVVYYSLTVDGSAHGLEEKGIGDDPFIFLVDYFVGAGAGQAHYSGQLQGDGAIVDVRHHKVYLEIADAIRCCVPMNGSMGLLSRLRWVIRGWGGSVLRLFPLMCRGWMWPWATGFSMTCRWVMVR